MIASKSQNQLQSSLAPIGDLFKALMFLSNLNDLPLHRRFKGLIKGNVLPRYGRKMASSDSITFFSLFVFLFLYNLCVLIHFKSVYFYTLFCLTCLCLFSVLFYFVFHIKTKKKKLKNQKNTKTVCVLCTLVLVYLEWPLKQSFLNFVFLMA